MPIRPIIPPDTSAEASAAPAAPSSRNSEPRRRARPAASISFATAADAHATEKKPDYAVGYAKPPRHSQFQAGRSGNPRGRPKSAKGLKTIVRETMVAKVSVRTAGGEKKMSRMEAVLHKTIELGMKGNPRALAQLISLYASAVPEAALPDTTAATNEELSATDLAMLEDFKASLLADAGDTK